MSSSTYLNLSVTRKNAFGFLIILFVVVLCIAVVSIFVPEGVDWNTAFRPAALKILSGRSPYEVEGYLNAPWTLIPLIPLALLPENVGRAALLLVSLVAYAYVAHNLGASRFVLIAFLLSPPVLHGLLNANIDWMAMLGFTLPPHIGLFFLVTKPQIGIGVGIFWLVEAWRVNRFREVIRVFWPITTAMLLSFLLFGLWPLRFEQEIGLWWNASLWPMSIPVGLALLVASFRTRQKEYAMAAAPCLSPYVLLHSWVGALAAILSKPVELIVAIIGLWLIVLLQFLA